MGESEAEPEIGGKCPNSNGAATWKGTRKNQRMPKRGINKIQIKSWYIQLKQNAKIHTYWQAKCQNSIIPVEPSKGIAIFYNVVSAEVMIIDVIDKIKDDGTWNRNK